MSDVQRLRELMEKATPAPWQSSVHAIGCFVIPETADEIKARPHFAPGLGHCYSYEGRNAQVNCDLIVAMRNALPAMIDERDADQAEIARLRALLREAEGPCHMVMGDLGKRIKAELEAKP